MSVITTKQLRKTLFRPNEIGFENWVSAKRELIFAKQFLVLKFNFLECFPYDPRHGYFES